MQINPADVKKLRDMTGAPMMKAKDALVEAGGDFDKATAVLRKAGQASANKKSDREARCGLVETYTHAGKIGVVVEINCETDFVARTEDFKTFAHDVAIQIAGANPTYISPADVPEDAVEKEKDVFLAELKGKPAEIADKIVAGKLDKFYQSVCLTKQPFVKDPEVSIEQLTGTLVAKLGENIVIRQMVRMELGSSL